MTHSTKPACGNRAFSINWLFSTPPIHSLVSPMKTTSPCCSRCLFRPARPPTRSPAPLCHVGFSTRARLGVLLGSIPTAACDLWSLPGLFGLASQRKSHFRPPPPLGHVKDWPRCDQTTWNSHFRPQSLFLVKRWFIFVQYPKVSLRQFSQYFSVGLCAKTHILINFLLD